NRRRAAVRIARSGRMLGRKYYEIVLMRTACVWKQIVPRISGRVLVAVFRREALEIHWLWALAGLRAAGGDDLTLRFDCDGRHGSLALPYFLWGRFHQFGDARCFLFGLPRC